LLHRIGCVSDDWEKLQNDAFCFQYVTAGLADEIAALRGEAA
jgi:hypothetical protein